jgi:hypothetical protein
METVRRHALAAGAVLLLTLLAAGAMAQTAKPQAGTWKEQEFDFQYSGFTSHYTCGGLREKMLVVLQELGARPGYTVQELYCGYPETLREHFPTVKLRFAALLPLAQGAAAGGATVDGAWKPVNLVGLNKLDRDECELAEQIAQDLLPLFAVRNVQKQTGCVPHQETINAMLRLEVFAPLAAAPH